MGKRQPEKPARAPLPLQPPKYYPGVGRCIYCSRADTPLSDEHIVPLAFGGNHVIRGASCSDCAVRTSAIERHVLRDYWGAAREALNFPTRRPARRSETLTLRIADDEAERTEEVAWDKFPAQFGLPLMEKPGRMRGVSPSTKCLIHGVWLITAGSNKAVEHQVTEALRIDDFVGFVAKLAHAFVFAQLNVEALTFWRALPGVIDRTYPFQFYLIGGVGGEKPVIPMEGVTRFPVTFTLHTQVIDGLEFLTVGVQMFADAGGPTYAAIFGARPTKNGKATRFVCS